MRSRGATEAVRYASTYARALFNNEPPVDVQSEDRSTTDFSRTPFRKAVFEFPSVPEHDMVVDIDVRIRPRKRTGQSGDLDEGSILIGRAQGSLELLENASRCQTADQSAWLATHQEMLVVDPTDDILLQGRQLVEIFEQTMPTSANYRGIIDDIRNVVLKGAVPKLFSDLQMRVCAIDQDGQACTQAGKEIVERIAMKFKADFDTLDKEGNGVSKTKYSPEPRGSIV